MGTQDAALTFTISGNSPASATTATIGSVVDTSILGGGASGPPGIDVIESLDLIYVGTGGTGGTLDLYLQSSPDNTTWTDLVHFTQVAAATASKQRALATRWNTQNPATVGQALVPALAATTALGAPQRFLRLVAVGGAGTSAGASQTLTIIATGSRKAA